jgi:hypothetical protein
VILVHLRTPSLTLLLPLLLTLPLLLSQFFSSHSPLIPLKFYLVSNFDHISNLSHGFSMRNFNPLSLETLCKIPLGLSPKFKFTLFLKYLENINLFSPNFHFFFNHKLIITLLVLHTSASLALNESWDPDVR